MLWGCPHLLLDLLALLHIPLGPMDEDDKDDTVFSIINDIVASIPGLSTDQAREAAESANQSPAVGRLRGGGGHGLHDMYRSEESTMWSRISWSRSRSDWSDSVSESSASWPCGSTTRRRRRFFPIAVRYLNAQWNGRTSPSGRIIRGD